MVAALTHASMSVDAVGTEPDIGSGFDAVFRSCQGRDFHGDGSSACTTPSHPLLSKLRHRLDRRRLWRPA